MHGLSRASVRQGPDYRHWRGHRGIVEAAGEGRQTRPPWLRFRACGRSQDHVRRRSTVWKYRGELHILRHPDWQTTISIVRADLGANTKAVIDAPGPRPGGHAGPDLFRVVPKGEDRAAHYRDVAAALPPIRSRWAGAASATRHCAPWMTGNGLQEGLRGSVTR